MIKSLGLAKESDELAIPPFSLAKKKPNERSECGATKGSGVKDKARQKKKIERSDIERNALFLFSCLYILFVGSRKPCGTRLTRFNRQEIYCFSTLKDKTFIVKRQDIYCYRQVFNFYLVFLSKKTVLLTVNLLSFKVDV